jgi:phosphate-selective porin
MRRVRFGIEGRFLKHFRYEAEYEFREAFGGREVKHPWRDTFIDFDYLDDFQLQVGKFKLPFSQEQNTGSTNLDFILRSRIAEHLAPARDVGAMLHGRFFNRGIGYEAGVFRGDGENASPADDGPEGGTTLAARLTGMPLRVFDTPDFLDNVEVSAAITSNDVPEGQASLRGQSYADETFFPHVFTNGRRLRAGADFNWTTDDFSIKAEYIRVNQEREGQSVRGANLSDVVASGWYLAGVWSAIEDDVQFAARYDVIRFGSARQEGLASRSPRAPNILENSDRAWTLGMNWFPVRYVKVQINGIRETFLDPERSPIAGREQFWMGIVRIQFEM